VQITLDSLDACVDLIHTIYCCRVQNTVAVNYCDKLQFTSTRRHRVTISTGTTDNCAPRWNSTFPILTRCVVVCHTISRCQFQQSK